MTETVAAVVVTFNRKMLLKECIDGLLNQSRPVDHVFIIDNASSDGTEEFLRGSGYLDRPGITYARLSTNSGGAGGFYHGISTAFAQGYDWIWVMDDDAEPMPDALERLAEGFSASVTAAASAVITPQNAYVLEHRGYFKPGVTKEMVDCLSLADFEKPSLAIEFCSFVGLCIRRETIERVGLPKREFFIHYDDNEYCLRMAEIGRIMLIPASKIIHKEAGADRDFERKGLLGRFSNRIKYERLWIRYFGHRNKSWLQRRRFGYRGIAMSLYDTLRLFPSILAYDDHRLKRLHFWAAAWLDGIWGRFDNEKPKRILLGS
jgi:rhamnopyranosyl-N-acetylglucosaminyl-diphospho-decaprenol beta-1,3/1,4-galactofuranosyltransferase